MVDKSPQFIDRPLAEVSCDPPHLFAWDVDPHQDGARVVGHGGVTDDQEAAVGRMRDALAEAPDGVRGRVRKVQPSFAGPVVYIELGTVAEARKTEAGVSWVS